MKITVHGTDDAMTTYRVDEYHLYHHDTVSVLVMETDDEKFTYNMDHVISYHVHKDE